MEIKYYHGLINDTSMLRIEDYGVIERGVGGG